jgi:hypothetical protein
MISSRHNVLRLLTGHTATCQTTYRYRLLTNGLRLTQILRARYGLGRTWSGQLTGYGYASLS